MFRRKGFTIVELLIVIVVIAILAAVTVAAYNGINERARNASIASDIRQVHKLIEAYNAENGEYPATTTWTISGNTYNAETRLDSNCVKGGGQVDWVPNLTTPLPQSDGNVGAGAVNQGGCYIYMSDGVSYILSAWNMLESPQTDLMYRRVGFREIPQDQYYWCDHPTIGGENPAPYDETRDRYRHSYTVTNIDFCTENEPTP